MDREMDNQAQWPNFNLPMRVASRWMDGWMWMQRQRQATTRSKGGSEAGGSRWDFSGGARDPTLRKQASASPQHYFIFLRERCRGCSAPPAAAFHSVARSPVDFISRVLARHLHLHSSSPPARPPANYQLCCFVWMHTAYVDWRGHEHYSHSTRRRRRRRAPRQCCPARSRSAVQQPT